MTVGFRKALRVAVEADHLATERAFDRFTRAPMSHLVWFLCCQRSALAALQSADAHAASDVLRDLLVRLDDDLARLRVAPAALPAGAALDPLARDHLILGSRLGTEVLRRQLLAEMEEDRLPAYFRVPGAWAIWKEHCARLDTIDAAGPRAARIIADTRRGFSVFVAAAALQPRVHCAAEPTAA